MRIAFDMECPSFGCGERGITIISVGPKWAKIEETATGTRATLARDVWDKLEAAAARRLARQRAWRDRQG